MFHKIKEFDTWCPLLALILTILIIGGGMYFAPMIETKINIFACTPFIFIGLCLVIGMIGGLKVDPDDNNDGWTGNP